MTTMKTRQVRPAATNGKISALSMVTALIISGVPAASIKLIEQITPAELDTLEAELDAIDYSDEAWTDEALARRTVIAKILDAAGRS